MELDVDPYLCTPDPDGSSPFRADGLSHFVSRLSDGQTHFHSLRHFTVSQLIGAGVDARTVAGRLGDSDATTTLRVYAHVLEQRTGPSSNSSAAW